MPFSPLIHTRTVRFRPTRRAPLARVSLMCLHSVSNARLIHPTRLPALTKPIIIRIGWKPNESLSRRSSSVLITPS